MAIYRCVQIKFWTDSKIADDFTPEDKYFYLYLFTNPHTNLSGCYEVSLKQMSDETGYNKDTIERLLDRFKTIHQVIDYSKETKEVLLLNWHKYNWTKSKDFQKGLINQISNVKNQGFKAYLLDVMNNGETVYRPSTDGRETSVTVTNTNNYTSSFSFNINNTNTLVNNISKLEDKEKIIKNIIDYLNMVCGSNYRYKTVNTKKHISARLDEGYTYEDFCMVIDKKHQEWQGTQWEKFLRPDTLFGTKFESYLNQNIIKDRGQRNLIDELWECD